MAIERVRMEPSSSGRPVSDRFMCDYGHLHPSFNHAVACHKRKRQQSLNKWLGKKRYNG